MSSFSHFPSGIQHHVFEVCYKVFSTKVIHVYISHTFGFRTVFPEHAFGDRCLEGTIHAHSHASLV